MAKIQFIKENKDNGPGSVEQIEVRVWGPGAKTRQQFVIGSGANFNGSGTLVLEIIYTVNDVQFFYTRNYLQYEGDADDARNLEKHFERFDRREVDVIGLGDMLPETFVRLEREKYSYQDGNAQEVQGESYYVEIGADAGAVVGHTSPGMRMINLRIDLDDPEDGIQFMRDLLHEVIDVHCGKHPNPADLPEGSSDWPFVRQLNQKAYDIISQDYVEDYFSNPLLNQTFDAWLEKLPSGGHILDAGCGHGKPVISRLLEKGFQVTGTDLSKKMLELARSQFPEVTFINQMVSDIRSEAEFDGACSFSSMLYLDPIDLSHSIYRLHRAIKPGGLLFLYAYDVTPGWRGLPYNVHLDQWMWSWSHGKDEVAAILEEFGYFKVLDVNDVTTEEEKEERIASWRKYEQEQYDKFITSLPEDAPLRHAPRIEPPKIPGTIAYCYAITARRTE